ncbi:hypothetical protein [Krasilnikovia sp. M28-CT-15]|uniref:hypothetical protein n=1 Tax=Krasilnikovia sp. M28-CT-15 TaxID=3373540 RepID=UPI00387705B3
MQSLVPSALLTQADQTPRNTLVLAAALSLIVALTLLWQAVQPVWEVLRAILAAGLCVVLVFVGLILILVAMAV